MTLGSYQALVSIDRPADVSEREGTAFLEFWAGAILADLFGDLNAMTPDVAVDRASDVAVKAHRWFADAWRSAGPSERRFRITSFVLQVFDEPEMRGRMLVEIDVLTGRVR